MNKELKRAIVNWLLDNETEWQRVTTCYDKFRQYIYTDAGDYVFGGESVSEFIRKADKLLYRDF